MATYEEWRIGYAKQARADLKARELLVGDPRLPACQHLHFLQMACEKVCKAYLCGQGSEPADLRRSHGYIAKHLPRIAQEQFARSTAGNVERSWVISAIRALAIRIEKLAPSMDQGGSAPANCEYPWEDSVGVVRIPAEHDFRIDLLREPSGRHLLKVLDAAVRELTEPGAGR